MSEYVPFKLSDDSETTILIEVSEASTENSGWSDAGIKETTTKVGEQAKVSLAAAMDNIKASAETVLSKLRDVKVSERPTKIELEFGLKLDATAGAIIAQAGTEVNYTVKLTWEKSKKVDGEHN